MSGYSADILDRQINILNRETSTSSEYASAVGGDYILGRQIWASVTFTKGAKAMRLGSLDAYDVIMVRTRYHADLKRDSRLLIDGVVYQIESYHADYPENKIQITASELQQAKYKTPEPSTPEGGEGENE